MGVSCLVNLCILVLRPCYFLVDFVVFGVEIMIEVLLGLFNMVRIIIDSES